MIGFLIIIPVNSVYVLYLFPVHIFSIGKERPLSRAEIKSSEVEYMSRVCIFLADGFEEVEALTVVDLLRRADIKIDMVSISDTLQVRGRSDIEVTADVMWDEAHAEKSDMLILPGGMPGVKYLGEHKGLTELLMKYAAEGRLLAAICAAPTVFGQLGLLKGRKATCYPGLEDKLIGAHHCFEPTRLAH